MTVHMILLPVESRQEAESCGQSLKEAIYHAQQPQWEAGDHGQSLQKPNMTESLQEAKTGGLVYTLCKRHRKSPVVRWLEQLIYGAESCLKIVGSGLGFAI